MHNKLSQFRNNPLNQRFLMTYSLIIFVYVGRLSSIVNEGIRALLNFFIFFYKKFSHAQKA